MKCSLSVFTFKNLLTNRHLTLLSYALVLCFITNQAAIAAFCSLRDPVVAIQKLYPSATNHRSVVRPITAQTRRLVANKLPFTLHTNEIGKHTLYEALDNSRPIGLIQARSELAKWGLIEVAWGINPDMTINGLILQRCRSPECSNLTEEKLSKALKGMSFSTLETMITEDGKALSHLGRELLVQDNIENHLYLTIVHSALKTLAVTELVWGDILK